MIDYALVQKLYFPKNLELMTQRERSFHSLSIISQEKWFTLPGNGIDFSLAFAKTHSNQNIDILYPPHQSHAAIATITSNYTMVAIVKQFLSEISNAWKCLAKNRVFQSLGYERMLSRSQGLTPGDKMSKSEQIQTVKESLLHEIQPHDQLDMYKWRCASQESLSIHAVSCSFDSNHIKPTHLHRKTPHTANQSNHAAMNKFNTFLRYGSLKIYNVF